jgi:hypothetical protein
MPRTRDLFLFGTIACFLLVALGSTVISQSEVHIQSDITISPTEPAVYTASVTSAANTLDRTERLALMRDKIAVAYTEPESSALIPPEELVESDDNLNDDVENADEALTDLNCAPVTLYAGTWNPADLQFRTSEGVRVVYRESVVTASTSTYTGTETVLQLPIRAFPDARPQCVASDVIGVAQDGSLIRNNEAGLYSVFSEETLVGYALDGFPIYGATTRRTDVCGGAVVAGQYGYYLSTERAEILNCFSAPPINLSNYGNAGF